MRPLKLVFLSFLCIFGSLLATERAQANCTANVTSLNFGNINPVTPGTLDVNATINYSCSSLVTLLSYIRVCVEIGRGPQDADVANRMLTHTTTTTEKLSYNIYSNPNRTTVFGNVYGSASPPVVIHHGPYAIGVRPTASGSVTVYGRLAAANPFMQRSVGQYNSTLPVIVKMALVSAIGQSSCTITGTPANISFPITARLISACKISAQPLNFGTHPSNFPASVTSTSTIASSCTKGTPYQIGLNNGLYAVGNQRRMKAGDGQFINYELHKDAARSQRWGATLNTAETLAGVATGVTQNATVYGRVPPQAGLRAANYKDTITVTITY
ncbi:lipoprotein [Advenella kashmirensis WT001]|uniref:Lipoprotein n=1 Tax=Advenella kashmirensis (strain DSM 17095 / LMG 22695 / WT001) TaxID=1036672 RepID=I3UA49_ADVKW|nr:spore coat U domain-containing protein [Advenella kashmirensis]AFK61887.1 lipoprotein [Advenella kashmirensis WT001]